MAGPPTTPPEPAVAEITGIVVPVPEARRYATHPHVTLLAPFGPRERVSDADLRAALRAFFAERPAFDFALVERRAFPDGHVYLAPDPAEPFRTMTYALAARFPEYPPYGGLFEDVIPHLTIDQGVTPDALPIADRASVAHLVHSRGPEWHLIDAFPLQERVDGHGNAQGTAPDDRATSARRGSRLGVARTDQPST